jgi:hypothetical protein
MYFWFESSSYSWESIFLSCTLVEVLKSITAKTSIWNTLVIRPHSPSFQSIVVIRPHSPSFQSIALWERGREGEEHHCHYNRLSYGGTREEDEHQIRPNQLSYRDTRDEREEHWRERERVCVGGYRPVYLMAPHGPRQTRWPNSPERAARVSELLGEPCGASRDYLTVKKT